MRRWSIALFRLCGIELEVHASFLLLLALAGYQGWSYGVEQGAPWRCAGWSVGFVVLVFVCVVLHELGHSLMARRFGVKVSRILLMPIGGMAQFDRIPREPGRELAIAIAGPAVNWVISALLVACFGWPGFVAGVPERWSELPETLLAANLALGVFNLLPAFPMDGGRMLRALLAMRLSYEMATRWSVRIGQVIAAAGFAFAIYHYQELAVLAVLFGFLAFTAESELNGVRQHELLTGLFVRDVMRRDFAALPAEATIATALELLRHATPQDIVLLAGETPTALLTRERLARAARAGEQSESCATHAEYELTKLQADWPVIPVAIDSIVHCSTLLPVLDAGRFVGVVDPRQLEESARLHHARTARTAGIA